MENIIRETFFERILMKSIFYVASLISSAPNIQCDLVHWKNHAHLDSSALVIHRVTSASFRQFLKDHAGNRIAFVNTVIPAMLTLIREKPCASVISTWYLNIENLLSW